LDDCLEGGLFESVRPKPIPNEKSYEACTRKMHIECARRAEYFMQYDGETETFEMYCSAHCPMPMKTELKQSLDE
jgi:hypothetical protein